MFYDKIITYFKTIVRILTFYHQLCRSLIYDISALKLIIERHQNSLTQLKHFSAVPIENVKV